MKEKLWDLTIFLNLCAFKSPPPFRFPPSLPFFVLTRARTALAVVLEAKVARILPTIVSPG